MTINGKEYTRPVLNFANMMKLENWGFSLDRMADRPLGFLSGYIALAMNSTPEDAAKEIDAHIAGGGSLDELTAELNRSIEESNFFKAPAEKKTAKG